MLQTWLTAPLVFCPTLYGQEASVFKFRTWLFQYWASICLSPSEHSTTNHCLTQVQLPGVLFKYAKGGRHNENPWQDICNLSQDLNPGLGRCLEGFAQVCLFSSFLFPSVCFPVCTKFYWKHQANSNGESGWVDFASFSLFFLECSHQNKH